MFSDSLLCSSHKNNLSNSLLNKIYTFCINFTDDCSIISKKDKIKKCTCIYKSLMYVRKNRGPRIDPWRAPVVIVIVKTHILLPI